MVPAEPRQGTLIETDDEIRTALRRGASENPSSLPPSAKRGVARVWRPTRRPPMATLVVYDDGTTDGEVIRIRNDRFSIGRTEGDLRLTHDELISTKHVEITRQQVGGVYRWVITDLQSTNGLFLRVTRAQLSDRSEILVGGGRYRFESPDVEAGGTVDWFPEEAKPSGSTEGWGEGKSISRPPALTELIAGGIGNRIVLSRPEYWVGTDSGCEISRPDDPFCEPRHCRIFRGSKGGWMAEHSKTVNGLWFKVQQVIVESSLQFQIGEQRFRFRN